MPNIPGDGAVRKIPVSGYAMGTTSRSGLLIAGRSVSTFPLVSGLDNGKDRLGNQSVPRVVEMDAVRGEDPAILIRGIVLR